MEKSRNKFERADLNRINPFQSDVSIWIHYVKAVRIFHFY